MLQSWMETTCQTIAAFISKHCCTDHTPQLRPAKLTANTLEAIRDCIQNLMRHMPLKECANCKASNPTIRR